MLCFELMSYMIDYCGVNYATQEMKQIFSLFQLKPEDKIELTDFSDTWLSKHEILLENTI